ncbi:MAG: hypothetical protein AAF718_15810 [Pseudomonadota bacterium]
MNDVSIGASPPAAPRFSNALPGGAEIHLAQTLQDGATQLVQQGHPLGQQPTLEPDDPPGLFGAAFLGSAVPRPANVIEGVHGTTAETAAAILSDVADGNPPFRPELGRHGGVQWFVTGGDPRSGRSPDVTLPVEIDLPNGAQVLEFDDADLRQIYESFLPDARATVEAQYAARHSNRIPGSNRWVNDVNRQTAQLAERMTWTEVGERVARSDSGIGRVLLSGADDTLSVGRPGQFMLSSSADAVRIRGGAGTLLDVIRANGIPAEQGVIEAAEQLARQGRILGTVDDVVRVGGRVMIIAGAAADAWHIYTADDQLRAVAEVAGGWAGAAAGVAAYNAWTGPTNAAGPWAWAANAVGNVVAGGIGYFAGSTAAGEIYDLFLDPDPIIIPAE